MDRQVGEGLPSWERGKRRTRGSIPDKWVWSQRLHTSARCSIPDKNWSQRAPYLIKTIGSIPDKNGARGSIPDKTAKKAQGSFTVGKRRKWQRRIILRMKTTGYSGCLLTNTVKSRPLHASKPPSGLSLIACADGNPLGVILPLRTLKSGCKLANTATLKDSHFFKSRSIAVAQPGVARQRRFVSDLRCR